VFVDLAADDPRARNDLVVLRAAMGNDLDPERIEPPLAPDLVDFLAASLRLRRRDGGALRRARRLAGETTSASKGASIATPVGESSRLISKDRP
jgi:hypothetical protein